MIFKDLAGNEIDKGMVVSFSMGLGQILPAEVGDLQTGLGLVPGTNQTAPPMAILHLTIPVPVLPNGVIPGVIVPKEAPEGNKLIDV